MAITPLAPTRSKFAKPEPESALVILVPEAESLAQPWRDQFDPTAKAGMPAHITIFHPFLAPANLNEAVSKNLATVFAKLPAFAYTLSALRRFPEVLYLAPSENEAFEKLILAVCDAYPDLLPYDGKHADIIPHLTLAVKADVAALNALTDEVTKALQGKLPLKARADGVALMEKKTADGNWELRERFALKTV